ncbi:hypothetical protein [Reinekea blandensis]|nr:hypothetical protein [Reinekea blandensis]
MKTKKPQRNGHACHAIMRKGGVHEDSKSGQRQKARKETRALIKAWRDHADHSLPFLAA